MPWNRADLLDQIEKDALDEQVPLATALRKCLVLGGKSGSDQLRDWATRELKGYFGEEEIPAYRVVPAPLRIDGIAGRYKVHRQAFPPASLPDFAREHIKDEVELRDGVGSIEALLDLAEIKLSPPMASDLALYMNSENSDPSQYIESLYWQVSHAAVRGTLDQVRTTLTQLVAELRAGMGSADLVPSAELANRAVNIAVYGEGSNVEVTTAHATGTQATASAGSRRQSRESPFWTRSRRVGAFIVGLATIAGVVLGAIETV